MSQRIQEAVVEEALKHSALMRTNCALKHGIDKDYGRTNLGEQEKQPAAPVQPPAKDPLEWLLTRLESLEKRLTSAATGTPSPGNPAPPAVVGLPPWAKLAAAGLLGSGLAASGYYVGGGGTRNSTTVINDPTVQSVIPWLEENGLNQP